MTEGLESVSESVRATLADLGEGERSLFLQERERSLAVVLGAGFQVRKRKLVRCAFDALRHDRDIEVVLIRVVGIPRPLPRPRQVLRVVHALAIPPKCG